MLSGIGSLCSPLRRRKLFELFVGFRLWHLVSLQLLKAALAQQDVPKSLQTKYAIIGIFCLALLVEPTFPGVQIQLSTILKNKTAPQRVLKD